MIGGNVEANRAEEMRGARAMASASSKLSVMPFFAGYRALQSWPARRPYFLPALAAIGPLALLSRNAGGITMTCVHALRADIAAGAR